MGSRTWNPIRALLFAPGNDRRKLRRLGDFGADAVVMDLEDAVAEGEKVAAREIVREHLAQLAAPGRPTLVRVNCATTGLMLDDVRAVLGEGLGGVVIPKVESRDTLWDVDAVVSSHERERDVAPGAIRIVVLVETAAGVAHCEEILARSPERVERVVFGSGDFRAELGLGTTPAEGELMYARGRLLVASYAAGLGAPIDGPFVSIEDERGLRRSCVLSRDAGFEGRVVVYPGQLATVAGVFGTPSAEEIETSRRIVAGFEAAEMAGSAAIRVDGMFVDYPIYHRAKAILEGSNRSEA